MNLQWVQLRRLYLESFLSNSSSTERPTECTPPYRHAVRCPLDTTCSAPTLTVPRVVVALSAPSLKLMMAAPPPHCSYGLAIVLVLILGRSQARKRQNGLYLIGFLAPQAGVSSNFRPGRKPYRGPMPDGGTERLRKAFSWP